MTDKSKKIILSPPRQLLFKIFNKKNVTFAFVNTPANISKCSNCVVFNFISAENCLHKNFVDVNLLPSNVALLFNEDQRKFKLYVIKFTMSVRKRLSISLLVIQFYLRIRLTYLLLPIVWLAFVSGK